MIHHLRVGLGTLCVCLLLVSPAAAQPQQGDTAGSTTGDSKKQQGAPEQKPPRKKVDRKLAITDLAQVDEDFHLQGEYLGSWSHGWQNLGLQVIARGDGQFDAVLLQGGLPGAGWDRSSRVVLAGRRELGSLFFSSKDYLIHVQPAEAVIYGAASVEIARLPKIHRVSGTQGALPPFGAIVLFDGTTPDDFQGGRMNEEGLLEVGGLTKMPVGDFRMHLEFRLPYMPYAKGQGRGNSGVYIQQRYEVQILDSFGLTGEHNECGGLYKQQPPDVNMCLPPLSWQSYDIYFTAARWDARGNKVANARITVLHNGEPIHQDYELYSKTGAGKAEEPTTRPILLQNHGNPVHFRNIWIELLSPTEWSPDPDAGYQALPIEASFIRGRSLWRQSRRYCR
jgi:hypothetical protein